MTKPKTKDETPALELLEEALHLLRQAPAALTYYTVGTVPFVLGLLFFWADMSRSAYAASRCATASLGLALGYIWMKSWQAAFTGALRRRLGAGQGARRGWRGWLGAAAAQAIVQPWGLALFLPALLITIPFPWLFAFFQNVTAIGLDEREGVRATVSRAWTQAKLWPGQNMMLLVCLAFFSLLVFVNIVVGLLAVPYLLKMLLGIQLAQVQSQWAILNSTFFASACALTWLCVDPLAKAAYVLRCFYGESLKTGEALWADLAHLKRLAGAAAAGVALILMLGGGAAHAQAAGAQKPMSVAGEAKARPPQAEAETRPAVSSAELDRSIQQTLRSPRYAWRLPRELKARESEKDQSALVSFVEGTLKTLGEWIKGFFRWIDRILDKLFSRPSSSSRQPKPTRATPASGFGEGWLALANMVLYVPLIIVLVTLGIFAWHLWVRRKNLLPPEEADDSILAAQPDLADEKTAADQLPTDGWLLLAQQMIDRGELRLAMRALYLASLAALAQAGLVRIRRSKSNLDYARELQRRAHAWPGLLDLFRANVAVFDRSWYGLHEVTTDGIEAFKSNYERIRSLVG